MKDGRDIVIVTDLDGDNEDVDDPHGRSLWTFI